MAEPTENSGTDVDVSVGLDTSPAAEGLRVFQRSADDVVRSATEMTAGVAAALKSLTAAVSDSMRQQKTGADAVRKAYAETADATARNTQGLKGFSAALSTIKTTLFDVKRYLLGLFAGFSLGAIIHEVSAFEASLSEVKKELTGQEGVAEALDLVARKAKFMGVTTTAGAREAVAAMRDFIDAGAGAVTASYNVQVASDLATASNISLGRATNIVIQSIKAFGLAMTDAKEVANTLTAADVATIASVESLGASLRFIGPIAKNAGLSFKDTVAALGALSESGAVGGRAVRQLAGGLQVLTNLPDRVSAQLQKMGVSTRDLRDDLAKEGGLIIALERLQGAGITTSNAVTKLGSAAGGAIANMMRQLPKMKEMQKAIDDGRYSVEAMADVMEDNLEGAFRKLQQAARGALLYLGTGSGGMSHILKTVVEQMAAFIRGMVGVQDYVSRASAELKLLNEAGLFLHKHLSIILRVAEALAVVFTVRLATAVAKNISIFNTLSKVVREAYIEQQQMAAAAAFASNYFGAYGAAAINAGKATTALATAATLLTRAWSVLKAMFGGWPGIIATAVSSLVIFRKELFGLGEDMEDLQNKIDGIDLASFLSRSKTQQKSELEQATKQLEDMKTGLLKARDILADAQSDVANKASEAARNAMPDITTLSYSPVDAIGAQYIWDTVKGWLGLSKSVEDATNAIRDYESGIDQLEKKTSIMRKIYAGTLTTIEQVQKAVSEAGLTQAERAQANIALGQQEAQLLGALAAKYDPLTKAIEEHDRVSRLLTDAMAGNNTAANDLGLTQESLQRILKAANAEWEVTKARLDPVRTATNQLADAVGDLGGRILPTIKLQEQQRRVLEDVNLAFQNGAKSQYSHAQVIAMVADYFRDQADAANMAARGVDAQVISYTMYARAMQKSNALSKDYIKQTTDMLAATNPLVRQFAEAEAKVKAVTAARDRFSQDPQFHKWMSDAGYGLEDFNRLLRMSKDALDATTQALSRFGPAAGVVADLVPELVKYQQLMQKGRELSELARTNPGIVNDPVYQEAVRRAKDEYEQMMQNAAASKTSSKALVDQYRNEQAKLEDLYRVRKQLYALTQKSDAELAAGSGWSQVTNQQEAREALAELDKQIASVKDNLAGVSTTAIGMQDAIRGIWEDFGAGLNKAVTNLFLSMFKGMSDFRKAMRDLFKQILAQIVSMAVQNKIVVPILAKVSGFMGAGGTTHSTLAGAAQSMGGRQSILPGEVGGMPQPMGGALGGLETILRNVLGDSIGGALGGILRPIDSVLRGTVGILTKMSTKSDAPGERTNPKAIMDGIGTAVDNGLTKFGEVLDSLLGGFLGQFGKDVSSAITGLLRGLKDVLGGGLKLIVDVLSRGLSSLWDMLKKVFTDWLPGIFSKFSKAFGESKSGGFLGKVWDGVKGVFGGDSGWLSKLGGAFKDIFTGNFSKGFGSIGDLITSGISKGWEKLGKLFNGSTWTDLSGYLKSFFSGSGGAKVAAGVAGVDAATLQEAGILNGTLTDLAGSGASSALGTAAGVAKGLFSPVNGFVAAVKDFGSFAAGIKASLGGVKGAAGSIAYSAYEKAIASGASVADATAAANVAGSAASLGGAAVNFGAGIVGGIGGAKLGEALGGKDSRNTFLASGGALIGSMFGPLGSIIGGAIGGVVSGLMGGAKKNIDSGLQLSYAGGEAVADEYNQYKKKKRWFKGWSGLRTDISRNSGLTDVLDDSFDAVFQSFELLGATQDQISKIVVQMQRISTKGKSADQVKAEITKWFADATISALQGLEGLSDSLVEVSDRFKTTVSRFKGDLATYVTGFIAAANLEAVLKLNPMIESGKLRDQKAAESKGQTAQGAFDAAMEGINAMLGERLTNTLTRTGSRGGMAGIDWRAFFSNWFGGGLGGRIPGIGIPAETKTFTETYSYSKAVSTPEDLANLAAALLQVKGAATALIATLEDLRQPMKDLFLDTAQRIRESTMTTEEKYSLRQSQFADVIAQLQSAVNPDDIKGLGEKANSLLSDAFFNLLDDSQKKALQQQYLDQLDTLQKLVDDRITAGQGQAQQFTVQLDQRITDAMLEAATTQKDAADRLAAAVTAWQAALDQQQAQTANRPTIQPVYLSELMV